MRLQLPRCRVSPDLRHTRAGVSHGARKALKLVGLHHVVEKGILRRNSIKMK